MFATTFESGTSPVQVKALHLEPRVRLPPITHQQLYYLDLHLNCNVAIILVPSASKTKLTLRWSLFMSDRHENSISKLSITCIFYTS